ncbi:MAG: glycosyltransferase family 2 protein [Vicinamibacterales bacterium]
MLQTALAQDDRNSLLGFKARVNGLSLCIPVYNESDGIAETLQRCLACEPALRDIGVGALEVIVVDDGSKDDTAALVRQFPVRLIQHGTNRGYGAALKTGFASARYDLVGFLDADATYPPEYFPALCRAAIENGAQLVIGSRMAGAETEMPLVRRLGNLVFARLVTLIGRATVTDSASGMRVFRRDALDILLPLPDGLNLTPVMSTRALHEEIQIVEVPIPYRQRKGNSKLHLFRDGVRFLETIVWTAMTYNPVRILGLLGLLGLGVAAAVGLALVALRLRGVTTLGPGGAFAVFAAVVSGAAGASLFALGASFNYLVSLFHRRPIRQGLFAKPIFARPIEHLFLPFGVASFLLGLTIAVAAAVLARRGWSVDRLWLYLFGSAMLILIGIQLAISWLEMSVLRELSARDTAEVRHP